MSAPDLLTVAESSGYKRTSYHREVIEFLAKLAPRTDLMSVQSMGKSGLGQDMPVAVLSADRAFTPEAAKAASKPIVLVIANIHAGEVEGKEACLMIARDATLGSLYRLIEKATVLLIPDYNPDGNDKIDVKNRKLDLKDLEGQVGPEGGVGTRYTGKGINLNRDYMKQEAVETRNLAALMAKWQPHIVADCHTTDGSVHGYELTYDTSRNLASCPPGPAIYVRDTLLPAVSASLRAKTGFRTWFYGNFKDNQDPTKGWESYPPLPRYGSHYRGLLGCMDVLLEAYSYVDFKTRCDVMYGILVELIDYVGKHGADVMRIVAEGRSAKFVGRSIGIDYGTPVQDAKDRLSFVHLGQPLYDYDIEAWDLDSQKAHRVPGSERKVYRGTYFGRYEPSSFVDVPFAYVVPAARTKVLGRLAAHRLEMWTLTAPWNGEVNTYRVTTVRPTSSPDVGDHTLTETVFQVARYDGPGSVSPGDVIVPLTQPWGHLAAYLLEPGSDDGLARWGYFDDVRAGEEFPVRRMLCGPLPKDVKPYLP